MAGNSSPSGGALYPSSIPISAKTGEGIGDMHEAVYRYVRGQQVKVELEVSNTNGKLLAFLESQCRIENRDFVDDKVRMTATVGKNFLRDLAKNEDVAILSSQSASEDPDLP